MPPNGEIETLEARLAELHDERAGLDGEIARHEQTEADAITEAALAGQPAVGAGQVNSPATKARAAADKCKRRKEVLPREIAAITDRLTVLREDETERRLQTFISGPVKKLNLAEQTIWKQAGEWFLAGIDLFEKLGENMAERRRLDADVDGLTNSVAVERWHAEIVPQVEPVPADMASFLSTLEQIILDPGRHGFHDRHNDTVAPLDVRRLLPDLLPDARGRAEPIEGTRLYPVKRSGTNLDTVPGAASFSAL